MNYINYNFELFCCFCFIIFFIFYFLLSNQTKSIYFSNFSNPLDRNLWRTSVRRCQVLPTPELDNRSTLNTKTGYDDDDDDDEWQTPK